MIAAVAFLAGAPAGLAARTEPLPKTCRGAATTPALAAAGGLAGCTRTVATARGVRIRYAVLSARRSPLGTVVFFTTRGASPAPIPQVMIVTPGGRILLVMPAPG